MGAITSEVMGNPWLPCSDGAENDGAGQMALNGLRWPQMSPDSC